MMAVTANGLGFMRWGRFRCDPGDDEFVHTVLIHVDDLEAEVVTDELIFDLWYVPQT